MTGWLNFFIDNKQTKFLYVYLLYYCYYYGNNYITIITIIIIILLLFIYYTIILLLVLFIHYKLICDILQEKRVELTQKEVLKG